MISEPIIALFLRRFMTYPQNNENSYSRNTLFFVFLYYFIKDLNGMNLFIQQYIDLSI
jgi:hypothetical protein